METGNGILLEILSTLDEKGFKEAQGELAKLGLTAKKTGEDGRVSLEKMEKAATKSKTSFTDLAAKVMVVYASVTKLVGAWTTQAKADKQLELSIKNNTDNISRQGQTVQQLTEDFKRFAQAREASTNIDDAETQRLQMMLLSMKELPQNVNKVVSAFQDMSSGTGKGVTELLNVWKKVSDASVANESVMSSLREAGVRLNESDLVGLNLQQRKEKVLAAVNAQYGGQSEEIAKAEGETGKFNVSIGNLIESMGKGLTDAIGPTINGLTKLADWFTALPGVLKVAVIGLVALGGVFVSATIAGTTFAAALKGILVNIGPIGWVVLGLGALGTAIGALAGETKTAEQLADDLNKSMSKAAGNKALVSNIQNQVQAIGRLQEGTDAYKNAVTNLLNQTPELSQYGLTATSAYGKIKEAVNNLKTALDDVTEAERKQIASSARKNMLNALKDITDPLTSVAASQQAARDYARNLVLAMEANLGRELSDSELANLVPMLNSLPSGSGAYNQSALSELAIIRRGRTGQLQNNRTGSVAITGGTAQAQKEIYDLEAARIAAMTDSYEKQREQIRKTYEDEIKKINESANTKDDKIQATIYAQEAAANSLAELEKKQEEEKRQREAEALNETIQTVNEIGGAIQGAFDVGTAVIKKDWMSAINSFLGAVPGIGSMLQGVFGSAVAFFDALITTSAEEMEEKLSKAIDKAKARANAASRVSDIEDTDDNTKALQARRDALRASIEQAKRDLKLTKDYSQEEWAEVLTAIEQDGLNGLKRLSATNQLAKDLRGKGVTDRVNYLKGISSDLWAWINDLEDLEPKAVVSGYMDEIQRIQDLVDTGRMSEEEAVKRQIEQYDRAIAALKGVAGAERLILELEKEKYNLLKAQNGEADKALLTAKQRQLLSDIERIDYEVKTGVRQDGYQTAQTKQALYNQLLSSMADSGLYDSEIYRKYNLQMSDMVKGYIGQDVFSAISGRGGAVTLPTASRYIPIAGGSTTNNSTNQNITNVSANLNLPPDLVQWLIRQVQTGAGRTLLS